MHDRRPMHPNSVHSPECSHADGYMDVLAKLMHNQQVYFSADI